MTTERLRALGLVALRLGTTAWLGAGVMFLAILLGLRGSPLFDVATKDQHPRVLFPRYYLVEFVCLGLALAGALASAGRIKSNAPRVPVARSHRLVGAGDGGCPDGLLRSVSPVGRNAGAAPLPRFVPATSRVVAVGQQRDSAVDPGGQPAVALAHAGTGGSAPRPLTRLFSAGVQAKSDQSSDAATIFEMRARNSPPGSCGRVVNRMQQASWFGSSHITVPVAPQCP